MFESDLSTPVSSFAQLILWSARRIKEYFAANRYSESVVTEKDFPNDPSFGSPAQVSVGGAVLGS
jgi:hypothetical protein